MKIEDKYKWLARDMDETLVAYRFEPIKVKEIDGWAIKFNPETFLRFKELLSQPIKETDDTFSHIKWEDEEPYEIHSDKEIALWVKEKKDSAVDNINKPTHYHKNGIDVIGFAEAQFSKEEQKGFHRINAIKYITRYDRKNGIEDLNKAKFYIDKLIEMEEQPHE